MKRTSICCVIYALSLTGCSSHLAGLPQDRHDNSIILRDLREEIADIKHSLSNTQVELQILEEQFKDQEHEIQKHSSSPAPQDTKIATLEKKLSQLSSHVNQTNQYLNDCHTKIAELEKTLAHQSALLTEVVHLKSSLGALTSSLRNEGQASSSYKVKAGDSLEKIAKMHKITISSLKEENGLSSNKIMIGQELKIPRGDPK